MAVSEELLVKVKIDTKDGTVAVRDLTVSFDDLKKAAENSGHGAESAGKSFSETALHLVGLEAAIELAERAFDLLEKPIEKALDAFLEADKAMSHLNLTLNAMGFDAEGASEDLLKFAESMQKTTTVSKEATLGMASIAKQMGLTNAQTKDIIETASGMAAVLNIDVNEAFQGLLGQLNGVAGRQAKYVTGLKDLNEAQLKGGQGLKLASDQYKQYAQLLGGTLDGQLIQTKNAQHEVWEEIGKTVASLINLGGIIQSSRDFWMGAAESVKAFGERIIKIRDALAQIPWEEFAAGAGKFGLALGAAFIAINLPLIITTLGTIGGALAGIAIPALTVAANFVAIAAAVLAVVIAVETLVANFDNLPNLADLVGKAFFDLFARLKRGLTGLATGFLLALEMILEPMSKISDTADAALGKVRAGLGTMANALEAANTKVDELDKSVKEAGSKVKMGSTLKLIVDTVDKLKQGMSETNDEAEKVNKTFNDISKKRDFGPSKEQINLLMQLTIENLGLQQQIDAVGQNQIKTINDQYTLLAAQTSEKMRQLEIDGKLAGEAGDAIVKALEQQLDLQRQITDQKILAAAQQEISKGSAVGQAVGTGALETGKGINSAIGMFNKAFETNIGKLDAGFIASFSIGASEFFSSWSGFMKGSADILGGVLSGAAGGLDSLFGTDLKEGADDIGGVISKAAGAIGGVFGGIFDIVMKLFDPKFIQGLADWLSNLVDQLPDMLLKAFDSLSGAMDKLVEKLPTVINKLFDGLGSIIDKMVAQAPKFIDGISNALIQVLDRLPEITGKLFASMGSLLDKLLSRLPDIILSLFNAIGKIISQFIKAIPGILMAIFDNLPAIIEAIIEGIIAAIGDIIAAILDFIVGGGLEKTSIALTKMIPKLIISILQGIIRGLTRALGSIFGGVKMPDFPKDVTELPKKLEKGMKELGKTAAKEASKVFKVLDLEAAGNKLDRMKQAKQVKDVIDEAFDIAQEKIRGLWENLIKLFSDLWHWVLDNVINPMINGLRAVWDFVYQQIVGPLVDGLTQVWSWVYDSIIAPFTNIVQMAWQGILDFFDKLFAGKINEAFAGVITTLQNIGGAIWNSFSNAFSSGTALFQSLGSQIWEGLKNGLGNFGGVIMNALNQINPANLLQKLFHVDGGGQGPVEKALGVDVPFASFAQGGLVPGKAGVPGDSVANDRVIALVSPGEAILPRSITQDPALAPYVSALLSGDPQKVLAAFFKVSGGGVSVSVGGGGVSASAGGASVGVGSGGISGNIPGVSGSIGPGGANASFDPGALSAGAKQAWDQAQKDGQNAIDQLKNLDPRNLWEIVVKKAWEGIGAMFTSNAKNIMKFHNGGMVPMYAGGGDVPAFLQPGEFVMNRSATSSLGSGLLNSMNQGGGMSGGDTNVSQSISVNISAAGQSLDETYVRTKLIPAVKDEFRKASLKGDFLISQRGVRET